VESDDERTQIDPRANPWAMLAGLPLFSGLPNEVVDAAVAELKWVSLPGGRLLFEAGAPADAVYFVVSGCLGVFNPSGELIGRIAAGESVGEMGLIVSRPRAATVRALRDSELATLSAGTFERVLLGHPAAILRLARLTVERLQEAGSGEPGQMMPRTMVLVPQEPDVDIAGPAQSLIAALARFGRVELVGSPRAGSPSPQWFHDLESRNPFVI
jgi:NTE family protein